MALDQALAFAILAAAMILFIWGRLRYDLVAILALLAAVFTGVVPHGEAFRGFGDDIVIIVASALVVSAAVARSGVMEAVLHRVSSHVTSVQGQIVLLVTAVTILSAFVKNIGALAMMIPVALLVARRLKASPSCFLMPMAFGSLLGGLVTLVGTSPNIIVSRVRGELTGQPFGMIDFAPVGLGLAVAGVVFLVFGFRLLPGRRKAKGTMDEALDIPDYMTEARVTAASVVTGRTVGDLVRFCNDKVMVTGIVRHKTVRMPLLPDAILLEGDILLLEGDPEALERAVARARLELEGGDRPTRTARAADEIAGIEAVVGPRSILIGQTAKRMTLHEHFNINLLAVSRSGQHFTERLRDIVLQAGDVLVLKGDLTRLPGTLRELGCLPLAERAIRLGNVRQGLVPVAVLGSAMALTAVGALPVASAFLTAAVLMVLLGALSLREAYAAIDPPILVMLGALIPVSEAIRTTGGADLIARGLSDLAGTLPPYGALALVMLAAMAVTPFLNNAATVLVMAPVAVSFAQQLGYRPDAFLMAVAVGAACDFLTPIGHQCNTLVMGPGGYRFGDYWRLGLPLSILVLVLGVPLILLVWPLV
ncbi:SLC13 family permease [Microvirga tunisiensis]|uniref:SLC13 family permease n=1 Tax=Microvirga tunisiensis TaxID=2108360 RepID=A0A5N7MFE6_9HYPH|nr:SLC13 family permease [Microvirga tunisiensis]MPR12196.1 SLC13 family permease [Microvirga tunisiensis]MPR25577.1 SLC13 family permease [Microvirga tunisiensis]